jgi:RNA polymerase sigma-70 factor (ECF subfamily)
MHRDDKLVLKMREGNKDAFKEIYQLYKVPLLNHISRLDGKKEIAEAVLSEVFITIVKKIGFYKMNKMKGATFRAWIYRIATNETFDFLRKKKHYVFGSDADYRDQLKQDLEDDNFFDGTEIEKKLQQALLSLPDKQRIVFNMKYFEELKY